MPSFIIEVDVILSTEVAIESNTLERAKRLARTLRLGTGHYQSGDDKYIYARIKGDDEARVLDIEETEIKIHLAGMREQKEGK